MAYFILGLVAGLGIGIWGTQRWERAAQQRRTLTEGAVTAVGVRPPGGLPISSTLEPPPITRKAAKVGITPEDLTPSDDILHRMQRAWDLGITLEELDAREAAGGAGALPDGGQPPPAPAPLEPSPEPEPALEPEPAPVGSTAAASPSTVTEAVARLAKDGYGDDLRFHDGELACSACGTNHPTDLVLVDRVYRFEGPSDPADEAIVLGLRCPACGAMGSMVSAFGPDADPELAQAFVYLASRADHG